MRITRPVSMRSLGMLVLAVGLLGMVGCQNGSLQQERDLLWTQNQELQDRYNESLAAQDAVEAENVRLRSQLASLESQPAPQPAPAAAANTGFGHIAGIETVQSPGQIAVRIPGDVLFAPGKAELREPAKRTLREVAAVLNRQYGNQRIRVEGYTDTDPIRRSNWTDNLELSMHRAAAVHRFLQEQGITADRMYAAGFGETQPRDTKANSRRVEIVVQQ